MVDVSIAWRAAEQSSTPDLTGFLIARRQLSALQAVEVVLVERVDAVVDALPGQLAAANAATQSKNRDIIFAQNVFHNIEEFTIERSLCVEVDEIRMHTATKILRRGECGMAVRKVIRV